MRLSISLLAILTLSGCQLGYLVKSSYHQMRLLSKRQSLDEALNNPNIDKETKRKIRLVRDVKAFAEEQITLRPSKNYESFVMLDDKYVVYAVSGSYKDRLEPYLWSFPIVGKVPYKGFFNPRDADTEKQWLESKNFDAAKRGVGAYSTLGWFADPLLSSMTNYNDVDLVETIIHETMHATVYIKSHADFNERLANFVGVKGMEAYYLKKEGKDSSRLRQAKDMAFDSELFSQFVSAKLKALDKFYKDRKGSTTLLIERENEFKKIQQEFEVECLPKLKTSAFKTFSKQKLNNAVLLTYKTYFQDLNLFERAFKKLDGNWERFIEYFQKLAQTENPQAVLEKWLNEASSSPQI